MSQLRRRLVEEALKEGYNLTLEAISVLESLNSPLETLRNVIRYLRENMQDVIVIGREHVEAVGPRSSGGAGAVSEIVFEKSLDETWTPSVEVDERYTRCHSIEGKTSEFHEYFRNRYLKLKRILEERFGSSSRLLDAVRSPRGAETSLIVMLLDKREKEDYVLLEVEDETAVARLIVPRRDGELAKRAERLLLDQVFWARVSKANNVLIVKELSSPDIPTRRRSMEEDVPDVYAVLLSDLHVGSRKFGEDLWEKFLDWIVRSRDPEAKRVGYIVIGGDLIDGVGIFPNQERELEYASTIQQFEKLGRLLSDIPERIKVVVSVGNHDPVEKAVPQPPLHAKYRKILDKDGRYVFVGNPALVKIGGRSLLVYHGQSMDDIIQHLPNASYSMLGREIGTVLEAMIQSRHLAPIYGGNTPILPTPEDMLVIETIPDIFHTGHVHVAYVGSYRDVVLVNSGTWQEQTNYQRELGLEPTVGTAALVNLRTLHAKLRKFS